MGGTRSNSAWWVPWRPSSRRAEPDRSRDTLRCQERAVSNGGEDRDASGCRRSAGAIRPAVPLALRGVGRGSPGSGTPPVGIAGRGRPNDRNRWPQGRRLLPDRKLHLYVWSSGAAKGRSVVRLTTGLTTPSPLSRGNNTLRRRRTLQPARSIPAIAGNWWIHPRACRLKTDCRTAESVR